nr:hypothetical protein [Tanacetum cinerariifolium]
MHVVLIRGVDVYSDFPVFFTKRVVTIIVFRAEGFRPVGSKDLICEDWMVNTRSDAQLAVAVQNALQTLLPQIRVEIREEFCTSSGPSGSGGNPPPVANAARNYEILYERDDNDAERPDKRQKSGDRHQPTTQQSSHRNHGHNNDRHGSDRRGGDDNHHNNNNYSGNNNRSADNGRDQRNRGQQSNRPVNSDFQQSRGPSEGYSYPKDCKMNTTASTSGQADKKPGTSGRVFAITEDYATKTSGTITGTLFIYGHAVFVLFDTGATHYVISSIFASCVTTTPTLLDHVLRISTPMKYFVRITHVYRDLLLQFDDKIHAINALPLDMCEFDIILGMDWLTEHHATIDCLSYRVIFGDIHAPEFIYHGSLPGKSMQIISALQARTLLSHGCEGFQATIYDTTFDVPSIHDQLIIFEFPDVFPDELLGIPPVRKVEFSIELIPGQNPSQRLLTAWLREN